MNKLISISSWIVLLFLLSCKSEKTEQSKVVTKTPVKAQTKANAKRPLTVDDYKKITSLIGLEGYPTETLIGNCKYRKFINEKLSESYTIFFESSYLGFRQITNDKRIKVGTAMYTVFYEKDFTDSLIVIFKSDMNSGGGSYFTTFKGIDLLYDLKGVDSVYEEKSSVCDGVFWLTRCTNPADSNFLQELPYYEAKVEYSMKYITAYEFRSKDKFNNVRRVVVDIDYDYDKMYEELDPKLFDITEYVEFTPKGGLILAEKYRKRGFRLEVR